ncbi:hypothetical protein F5B17DRAFT_167461 [Nemania serpens]|nr:hypothetical protein F5B17DRAFT_167461 [Nemania serpens]
MTFREGIDTKTSDGDGDGDREAEAEQTLELKAHCLCLCLCQAHIFTATIPARLPLCPLAASYLTSSHCTLCGTRHGRLIQRRGPVAPRAGRPRSAMTILFCSVCGSTMCFSKSGVRTQIRVQRGEGKGMRKGIGINDEEEDDQMTVSTTAVQTGVLVNAAFPRLLIVGHHMFPIRHPRRRCLALGSATPSTAKINPDRVSRRAAGPKARNYSR